MLPLPRTSSLLAVPHGFLGREGGVSKGAYQSLNCRLGSDDTAEAVQENRRLALAAVAPRRRLVSLHQCHSATALEAAPWSDTARPQADGLATREKGLALGIVTADCAPVLLADREAGVIGAAHAGWRGAFGGILEATVGKMVALGARPEKIAAVVGPHIGPRSYEVDDTFRARFLASSKENARFFRAGRAGHHFFDLGGYALSRLQQAGVGQVADLGEDTLPATTRYFSYRRATLAGETNYGCQLSLIAL